MRGLSASLAPTLEQCATYSAVPVMFPLLPDSKYSAEFFVIFSFRTLHSHVNRTVIPPSFTIWTFFVSAQCLKYWLSTLLDHNKQAQRVFSIINVFNKEKIRRSIWNQDRLYKYGLGNIWWESITKDHLVSLQVSAWGALILSCMRHAHPELLLSMSPKNQNKQADLKLFPVTVYFPV